MTIADFTQGDTVQWTEEISGYPSSEYVISYVLRGPSSFTVTGVNGTFTITATQSNQVTPGSYWWQLQALKNGNRITIGNGRISVFADFGQVLQGYDGRSQLEKDLDAVKAAIRAIAAGGAVQSYSIRNRSLNRYSLTELTTLKNELARELAAEKRASGEGSRSMLITWGRR
ncbi:MAG: hypothetical protein ACRC62_32300 [Microcoleus sp.]